MRIGAGLYHWRELPQVSFFRDKTRLLSQQAYFCREKTRKHLKVFIQETPFVYFAVAQPKPIRVDYKVLQLLQSGRWGARADTDLVRTEI